MHVLMQDYPGLVFILQNNLIICSFLNILITFNNHIVTLFCLEGRGIHFSCLTTCSQNGDG